MTDFFGYVVDCQYKSTYIRVSVWTRASAPEVAKQEAEAILNSVHSDRPWHAEGEPMRVSAAVSAQE